MAPLKPGVKLVFVAAPDQEMAEYLRAERAGDIPGWQGYLGKYATGPHASAASKSLAALYLGVANTDLQAYRELERRERSGIRQAEGGPPNGGSGASAGAG